MSNSSDDQLQDMFQEFMVASSGIDRSAIIHRMFTRDKDRAGLFLFNQLDDQTYQQQIIQGLTTSIYLLSLS